MRLHVAINLFNGEELLEANVRNLRRHARDITVLWQAVSYFGDPAEGGLVPLLDRLRRAGLIDHLIRFEPDLSIPGEVNETAKRNLGLDRARQLGATHHLDCDVDEFFIGEQLATAMRHVERRGLDTTACRIFEYHKTPRHRCREPRPDLFAPFIHRVGPDSRYTLECPLYPVRIDPTRRISPFRRFALLGEELVTMEHFSLVRHDLLRCKVRDALNRGPNLRWRLDAVARFDGRRYDIVDDTFGLGDIG
jgi:hypothetical protein